MAELALFKGKKDRYFTVTVSSREEPKTDALFKEVIDKSLQTWKKLKIRAVWFKVYLPDCSWVPKLASKGFVFHHAKTEYVTMVKWLLEDEDDNIPNYAHNTVGVGAIILNDKDEILVVRDKHRVSLTSSSPPPWQFPGGYVEPGEDLGPAIEREVKEETGIDAEVKNVVAFRHIHKVNFDCSDLYFVMNLVAKSSNIKMCKKELMDCKWMKVTEFLFRSNSSEASKVFLKRYLEGRENGFKISSVKMPSIMKNKDQLIYYIEKTEETKGNLTAR